MQTFFPSEDKSIDFSIIKKIDWRKLILTIAQSMETTSTPIPDWHRGSRYINIDHKHTLIFDYEDGGKGFFDLVQLDDIKFYTQKNVTDFNDNEYIENKQCTTKLLQIYKEKFPASKLPMRPEPKNDESIGGALGYYEGT